MNVPKHSFTHKQKEMGWESDVMKGSDGENKRKNRKKGTRTE
jgi:hypothetical protein